MMDEAPGPRGKGFGGICLRVRLYNGENEGLEGWVQVSLVIHAPLALIF